MKMKTISFCLLSLMILCTFVFYPLQQVIAFTYQDQNELLAYLPVKEKDTFQILYTHSIHLSDVLETYQVAGKKIIQTELAYKDFAVGMPSGAEGQEVFKMKNGTYYLKNMQRQFEYIDLRIGQVRANHRLLYNGRTYTLSEYLKPGTWIRISPMKISLWKQLRGVNMNG